jgi:hypothetical protein
VCLDAPPRNPRNLDTIETGRRLYLSPMPRSRSREAHHSAHAEAGSSAAVEDAKWAVKLPPGAAPPLRVWINGVEQRESDDYALNGRRLEFDKPLAKEGRLGLFRWLLIFFGIAGTYRKNDSVDAQYTTATGEIRLVTGLDIDPPD